MLYYIILYYIILYHILYIYIYIYIYIYEIQKAADRRPQTACSIQPTANAACIHTITITINTITITIIISITDNTITITITINTIKITIHTITITITIHTNTFTPEPPIPPFGRPQPSKVMQESGSKQAVEQANAQELCMNQCTRVINKTHQATNHNI